MIIDHYYPYIGLVNILNAPISFKLMIQFSLFR